MMILELMLSLSRYWVLKLLLVGSVVMTCGNCFTTLSILCHACIIVIWAVFHIDIVVCIFVCIYIYTYTHICI